MTTIRELRKELKLSISKISQQAGVNASTLCQAELGKLAPSTAVRATLANFYGISEGNAVFTIKSATAFNGTSTYTYEAALPPIQASGGSGVTLTGSGWGHGVGMSQRGAEGMARMGYTYTEILRHYYYHVVLY